MPLPLAQVQELRDRLSDRFRPWSRSAQFWVRAVDIYGSYKVRAARGGGSPSSCCSIGASARARAPGVRWYACDLTVFGWLVFVVQVCQLRTGFVKDEEEREAMWEQQHEIGAQKMYSLCSELGGLFLKVPPCLPLSVLPSDRAACLLVLYLDESEGDFVRLRGLQQMPHPTYTHILSPFISTRLLKFWGSPTWRRRPG